MKKIIILITILIALIAFILLARKDKVEDKIVVSEVTHSVFYTPWYVALEKGYFKEEGLDIEVILTPGADKVATSVISGDANIGFSGPEATIYVYNNSKQKLISFASLTKRDGQFIFGPCSLKDTFKISDLMDKTVLAGRAGGMPLLMFKYALKESNFDENNLIIDSSVDFASLSSAYISKQGDFVNLFDDSANIIII
jgi:NitT/TauT family transport system substrate-binding protein